jgi:hypothetical protein
MSLYPACKPHPPPLIFLAPRLIPLHRLAFALLDRLNREMTFWPGFQPRDDQSYYRYGLLAAYLSKDYSRLDDS